MIPKVVVIRFERTGIGYGGVGLIRHHVGRLVGIVKHTRSMKKKTGIPPPFLKLIRL